mmetsp:Transcript_105156/g.302362  ORF Transcript_105156/g.302362 Transcript_105156/m.302362 type:complete len:247 (-) Transcript_105156:164-904(-)
MGQAESGILQSTDFCNAVQPEPGQKRRTKRSACDPASSTCCRSQDNLDEHSEYSEKVAGEESRSQPWGEISDEALGLHEVLDIGSAGDGFVVPDHKAIGSRGGVVADARGPAGPSAVPPAEEASAEAWIRRLRKGTEVALDRETVRAVLDTELWCLEIPEHDLLYPLAELRACTALGLPQHFGEKAALQDVFELEVAIADFDELIFQFDEAEQRDGFAAALEVLAAAAQRGQLPEGGDVSEPEVLD